ncbi:signal recognition particle-docking protein FtsY [Thermoplasmatales archaeon SW_10_69_26]|nr:MAG: signal recognition particle-docking protein FtsY [Thermoplasmatales archaeon SW_10_69_26]
MTDVGEEAEDASVSTEDLQKSEDELEAELEAELAELEEGEEDEPAAEAETSSPELDTEPAAEPEPQPEPEPEPEPEVEQGGYQIDPERVEDLLWDLELVLLEADVAQEVARELRDEMERRLPRIRVDAKSEVPQAVESELTSAIRSLLEGRSFKFDEWLLTEDERPLTVMFVGVNGTGKTTTIARVAHRMKELGFSSVLAAGDTYRAGAIEQLKQHGDKLGVRVVNHEPGSDAAAVAFDAIDHAESRKKDLVLVDTAGRMQTDSNLMDELAKIDRVADPDLTIFVGDSLAGNDAIEQAKEFDKAVGVDASVLTKVDTDAKGGAALSIAHAVGKPVAYLGVGEGYDDLIPFDPDWMIERIFE